MNMNTDDDPFAELYNNSDDPFAALYQPSPQPKGMLVYVAANLGWIMVRDGACGEWVNVMETWYRKLDANAYLWFEKEIDKAFLAMKISKDDHDSAVKILAELRMLGLKHNAFTEIALTGTLPRWYSFGANCPKWADLV
jgi:hypothetical protein